MTTLLIKLCAYLVMLIDHIGAVFSWTGWNLIDMGTGYMFRIIGRIAFPLFAACLAVGATRTTDKRKYFDNLCLSAALSQIPFTMTFNPVNLRTIGPSEVSFEFAIDWTYMVIAAFLIITYWYFGLNRKWNRTIVPFSIAVIFPALTLKLGYIYILYPDLNVLYTLTLGAAILTLLKKIQQENTSFATALWGAAAAIMALISYGPIADYGTLYAGLFLILFLGFFADYKIIQCSIIMLWGLIYYLCIHGEPYYMLGVMGAAAIWFLGNGQRGNYTKAVKTACYTFYPAHLAVLGILNAILKNGLI